MKEGTIETPNRWKQAAFVLALICAFLIGWEIAGWTMPPPEQATSPPATVTSLPTATATARPTLTPTKTPTPTPSPTATATPTRTPTPRPTVDPSTLIYDLYLPLIFNAEQ